MKKTKLWVKSDLNGFFGLFTNNLTNIITMASLLIFVVGLPLDIVYRKIIPATGLSIFIASGYYAYMAYKLANKTGREDVTALPAGPSVTHMFLIVFMVLGPIYWTTGDADLDVNTEKEVLNNLKNIKDMSVIIVTHRLEALSICNRIIEFKVNDNE